MIKYEAEKIKGMTCDICKASTSETMLMQEFLNINFIGGYASVFGDGEQVNFDICDKCLFKIIKDTEFLSFKYNRE